MSSSVEMRQWLDIRHTQAHEVGHGQRPRARDVPQRVAPGVAVLSGVRQFPNTHAIQHDPHDAIESTLRSSRRASHTQTPIYNVQPPVSHRPGKDPPNRQAQAGFGCLLPFPPQGRSLEESPLASFRRALWATVPCEIRQSSLKQGAVAKTTQDGASCLLGRLLHPDFSSLNQDVIGLGEQALRSCQEMTESAAALIEDNRKLMNLNRKIKRDFTMEKRRRNSAGPNRKR